jgi:ankyrin repeat protein
LHEAVLEGDSQLVEHLLSVGADINATDNSGITPTDLADSKGHSHLSLELRYPTYLFFSHNSALGGVRIETATFTPSAHVDLASEKIGGKVLWANDEFFAKADNLIKPGRGTFQFGVVKITTCHFLIFYSSPTRAN